MRSGKDAIAAYLAHKYGYTRFAFGDELKRHYYDILGQPPDGTKPREGLQWFGQAMRERDPDVWVRKAFGKIRLAAYTHSRDVALEFTDKPFSAVITDVRQPNEFDRCRAEGYVIIRVTAPEGIRINRAVESADTFNLRDLTHDTESHVEGFAVDYEIENSGTLAELYTKVDAIMDGGGP